MKPNSVIGVRALNGFPHTLCRQYGRLEGVWPAAVPRCCPRPINPPQTLADGSATYPHGISESGFGPQNFSGLSTSMSLMNRIMA